MRNVELLEVFRKDSLLVKDVEKFREVKTATSNARMKSTQDPDELRRFLQHLRQLAPEINNYFEVGCSGGGTYYFITSFLKAINPHFDYAVANDIRDKVRQFDEFKAFMDTENVYCEKLIMNSHKLPLTKKYDLVLVDANHTFEGVMTDYVKWKDHAKYLAFHDVAYKGEKRMCGVPSAWMLIKQNYSFTKEFVNLDSIYPYPQGIGIIHTETEIKVPIKDDKTGVMVNPNKDWWSRYQINE